MSSEEVTVSINGGHGDAILHVEEDAAEAEEKVRYCSQEDKRR